MVVLSSADNRIDVRTWLRTLRYREIHALSWGFGLGAGAALGWVVAPEFGRELAVYALSLLVWAFTGSLAVTADLRRAGGTPARPSGSRLGLPHRTILSQVYREPHYYVGGLTAGVLLGAAAVGLTTSFFGG